MSMRSLLLAALAMAISPVQAEVRFEFVQSQAIASPAGTGLRDGLILRTPAPKEKWPEDIMPSVPESKIAMTRLAMRYSIDHAYPSYVLWVRVGNAISVTLGALILVLVIMGRRLNVHA